MGPLSSLISAWSTVVAVVTTWAIVRSQPKPKSRPASVTRALLVRPCTGDDAHLEHALRSSESARHAFPIALRVAIAASTDPAFEVATRVVAELVAGGLDARVVLTHATGPNRKADQIARVLAAETSIPEVVIIADSDVNLDGVSLDDLVMPFADSRIAAVWCAPIEANSSTIGDRASSSLLDASLHSFSLLAALDPRGMVGKLMALRSDALTLSGGFATLVAFVGEDMEIARRLHAAGARTELAPMLATSLAQGRSSGQVIERYARWLAVIRAQRPWLLASYPLLFVATPLIVGASAVISIFEGDQVWLAAALSVVARLTAAIGARVRSRRPIALLQLPIDIVLADTLLTVAFLRAIASRTTRWRGVALRIADHGTIREELR